MYNRAKLQHNTLVNDNDASPGRRMRGCQIHRLGIP